MRIEQIRPTHLQVSLHSLEMATLVAAARWIVDGCQGEMPADAVDQLRQVLANYDAAWQQKPEKSQRLTPERS